MEVYDQALESFEQTRQTVLETQAPAKTTVKILLNLAKTHYALEQYAEAERYYREAVSLDDEAAQEHSCLASAQALYPLPLRREK